MTGATVNAPAHLEQGQPGQPLDHWVLAGGFTTAARQGRAQGVSLLRLRPDGGHAVAAMLALANPSYLVRHPLLAHRVYLSHSDGAQVSAIDVDLRHGCLALLSQQPAGGHNGAHLACAPDGSAVLVASFGSGHVTALPLAGDGSLLPAASVLRLDAIPGPLPSQTGCQPHQIAFAPDGRHVLVPDRGADGLWILDFDAARCALAVCGRAQARPGAGPRHLVWHPRLPLVYVGCELDCSVAVWAWDASAARLTPLSTTSALPPDFGRRNISAAICISACGRWLYLSNRGQDAVAMFAVSPDGASLMSMGWQTGVGVSPRFMLLEGAALWVAAHGSDEVRVFNADPTTGALCQTLCLATPSPACLLLLGEPRRRAGPADHAATALP